MINFTIGPVQSSETVLQIGGTQIPYFRTDEFSHIMLENEQLIQCFVHSPIGSRVLFLTCSGTGGMEAAVMNCLSTNDNVLVVNGGSFGARFVELLSLHHIPYTEISLESGKTLCPKHLAPYEGQNYTAFVLQHHETSTGVRYDLDMVGAFCRRNGLFLVVDAISSFLCDPLDMSSIGADVIITGSQKALACAPGVAVLVLSPIALQRIATSTCCCRYLDFQLALSNMDRGQTPWTPAVGVLLQIHQRLMEIEESGGAEVEIARCASLAAYFRTRVSELRLPFDIYSESLSNAVTPLHSTTQSAHQIFLRLKEEYGIWICPNGGDLRDRVFRVGHIGCLTTDDYDTLLCAFIDLQKKNFI